MASAVVFMFGMMLVNCSETQALQFGSEHSSISINNALPSESFQLAKATFLPNLKDSEIGFSDNELDGNYNNNKGVCSNKNSLFTSKNCMYPKALVAGSQCPFLPGYYTQCKCLSKFNKTSCDAPYVLGGDSCDGKYEKCVCPAKVELTCPNDTCTKTCEGNCIAKSCTPTANQIGCTNGTKACDDGCCGTNRKCCVPCTNKITSKPANSSYTYSSCTDGEGSKQIQTGWVCNPGYHEKNGGCEKDCQIDSCSAYPLTSCPSYGNCSKCTKTAQDCSTDGTRYKLDSCASGYKVSGNKCVKALSIGDILYSDKTTSSDIVSGKTPIGVVFDTQKKLAVAINHPSDIMVWAREKVDIPGLVNYSDETSALTDFNGYNNTRIIMAHGNTHGYDTPAADFCYNYSTLGTSQGDWYLPAYGELRLMYNNINILNTSLSKIGGTLFHPEKYEFYWSSTEYTAGNAYGIYTTKGEVSEGHKYLNKFSVCPIIKF